jgi:hypothetical protein
MKNETKKEENLPGDIVIRRGYIFMMNQKAGTPQRNTDLKKKQYLIKTNCQLV